MQGAHRCSVCNFDYTTLAADPARRERWMLENLRRGPMFQLAVLHLYRHVMQLSPVQANAEVVAFARRNGVKMPSGKPLSPLVILGSVVVALVMCAVVAFLLMR
jgi:hypothetical protein